jgi:branched-subunit amino acid aminotransferase/4-amino-4-deoxychorismate lyase
MQSSCRRTLMAELPTDKFVEACQRVVKDNIEYVPPYGSSGALYIRPLLFGSGPRIGLQPADEYTFLCMVIPVGDYYKGGLANPVKGRIIMDYDRAAPRGVVRHTASYLGIWAFVLRPAGLLLRLGFDHLLAVYSCINAFVIAMRRRGQLVRFVSNTSKIFNVSTTCVQGNVKVAGNYAADLLPNTQSKKAGFPIGLYLDAATQTKIEEFSTSNFVGIRYGRGDGEKDTYVTPSSPSVLPSITNKALMQVAKDQGLNVEQRDVLLDELSDMDEVFAVGTAVVLTPVGSLTLLEGAAGDGDSTPRVWTFGENPDEIGPVTRKLYDQVRAIQNGEQPDLHGWNVQV